MGFGIWEWDGNGIWEWDGIWDWGGIMTNGMGWDGMGWDGMGWDLIWVASIRVTQMEEFQKKFHSFIFKLIK